jgi:hypothetical protein
LERAQLAELLGDQSEAHKQAREALLDGGEFHVWDDTVSAAELTKVYTRRLNHTVKRGIDTLELPEAVEVARRHGDAEIRLARIIDPAESWVFMLFLHSTDGEILACTGVRQGS